MMRGVEERRVSWDKESDEGSEGVESEAVTSRVMRGVEEMRVKR